MKAINEIQLEAEQEKQELFAEMSEKYYEIEREAVEKLRELAQERVKIYKDAKTAIQRALDDHETRLVDIETDYNDRIIEINENTVAQLRDIGIDSHRDRLDDTLDFHDELESIEDAAQEKREGAAEDHEKRIADIANERNKDLLGASRDFVGDSLKAFETFQSALGDAEDPAGVFQANDRLNETIGNQLQGLIRSVIGDEADTLFSVDDFDAFEFLGISGANNLTSDSFIQALTSSLPDTIGRLRSGELLGASDATAASLAQLLQGTSINENTGGILGAFRDAGTVEDARYLEVLDNITEWEIAAKEVILNTQSLIIQAGVDRTGVEGASLTQRDAETQVIAEGQNQAQAGITTQEIFLKQATRDTLNQLIVDYTNQALTIDAQTRVAIQAAQKQAADSFWSGVLEIGGTVLGVAAGAALSAATGGVVPPNVAIGLGAQLGKAGGGLLADAVIDDDELFHYHETDMIAKQSGIRSAYATKTQRENAEDFSKYFGEGFTSAFTTDTAGDTVNSVKEMIVNAETVILNGDLGGKGGIGNMISERLFDKEGLDMPNNPYEDDPGERQPIGWHNIDGKMQYGNINNLGTFIPRWRPTASPEEIESERQRRSSLGGLGRYFDDNPRENENVGIGNITSTNTTDFGRVATILQAYQNAREDDDASNDSQIGSLDAIIREILERAKSVPGSHYNTLLNLIAESGGFPGQAQNALFHFPETDWIARDNARSEALRTSQQPPYFPDQNQKRNANDISREIAAGVMDGLNIGNRNAGLGGQQDGGNTYVTVLLDSEQIVTTRFAEKVDDQISINKQSGNARR